MYLRTLALPRGHSVLLLGPRMTGKSTWIRHLLRGQTLFEIDLLSSEVFRKYSKNPSLLQGELARLIQENRSDQAQKYVFIDEVQRIPELLNEVQSLMERERLLFVLTGSSARKLRRGGANLLAGRALDLRFFPLTYAELSSSQVPPTASRALPTLREILTFGLLPKVVTEPQFRLKQKILKSYVDLYLKEEIQAEQAIRNIGPFSRFIELAAATHAQELNWSAMSREIGVSAPTVRAYFQVLEDTLLGFFLPPWEKAIQKQLAGHPKFYFFDTGVLNAITQNVLNELDPRWGALFESYILHELRAHCAYEDLPISFFFWCTKAKSEVDVLLVRGKQIIAAIEIKFKQEIASRDLSGLKSFHEEHPDVPRWLVCNVDLPRVEQNIQILPWNIFLKELSSWLK